MGAGVTTAAERTGYLAALASADLATIPRLRVLLAHHDPAEAWAVATGRGAPHPAVDPMLTAEVRRAWCHSADRAGPVEWARRCALLGITAVCGLDRDFPEPLRHDPQPPAVLFFRGSLGVLGHRRAGIVGTRNATGPGRRFAHGLGRRLAEAEVVVVSGLARGIDGAAHRGALTVDPSRQPGVIGVVANGLDRPYPRQHAQLWASVAEAGLLVSEWPPGAAPERYRFPLRNRVLAALSEVLVVVESRERGGSLTTAREALERSIEVMAVPGGVDNRAAAGTNQLIRDGATPVTDASDVLLALGLDHRRAQGRAFDPRPLPRGVEAEVLDRCRAAACTLDHVVGELGLTIADAAMTLARLERSGWVRESGGWFEPVEVVSCPAEP
jgi:DNA processing protein